MLLFHSFVMAASECEETRRNRFDLPVSPRPTVVVYSNVVVVVTLLLLLLLHFTSLHLLVCLCSRICGGSETDVSATAVFIQFPDMKRERKPTRPAYQYNEEHTQGAIRFHFTPSSRRTASQTWLRISSGHSGGPSLTRTSTRPSRRCLRDAPLASQIRPEWLHSLAETP